MKSIFISTIITSVFLFTHLIVLAQDADKTVTLVVSGQGKTQDEAKQNALRSAIEQAFGAFISSKTEILNDNLVKDEIVSVSNGNIQKFEIISEVQIPNGDYATSLKATVSVTKLTSFVESKGVVVEFKGSLFAFNVNQQILNEKNEIKAIEDLCTVITKLSDTSFDYSIKASDPIAVNASNEKWSIPLKITITANKNLISLANYFNQTLKGISLISEEAKNYLALGKRVYPVCFAASQEEKGYYILRSENSIKLLLNQLFYFNKSLLKFQITNGISDLTSIKPLKTDNNFYITMKEYYAFNGGYSLRAFRLVSIDKIEAEALPSKYLSQCPINPPLEVKSGRSSVCSTLYNIIEANKQFQNQFAFVKQFNLINADQLEALVKDADVMMGYSGLIISFIGISDGTELVSVAYEDIKSLEEINQIKEYKVSAIVNKNE